MKNSVNLPGRLKHYLIRGITVPLLLGIILWMLMPFVANKNANMGYEDLLAAIDEVKVSPLSFGGILINSWIVFLPPKSGKWVFWIAILPVIVAWFCGVYLISDAAWGLTNLKLLMDGR